MNERLTVSPISDSGIQAQPRFGNLSFFGGQPVKHVIHVYAVTGTRPYKAASKLTALAVATWLDQRLLPMLQCWRALPTAIAAAKVDHSDTA